MQFSTLFLGNFDLQVRKADEYLFDILITAGKKGAYKALVTPRSTHNTGVDKYRK